MLCFLVSILQVAYFCRTMFSLTTNNLVNGSTVALMQCVCMYYMCVHTPGACFYGCLVFWVIVILDASFVNSLNLRHECTGMKRTLKFKLFL